MPLYATASIMCVVRMLEKTHRYSFMSFVANQIGATTTWHKCELCHQKLKEQNKSDFTSLYTLFQLDFREFIDRRSKYISFLHFVLCVSNLFHVVNGETTPKICMEKNVCWQDDDLIQSLYNYSLSLWMINQIIYMEKQERKERRKTITFTIPNYYAFYLYFI